MSRTLIIQTEPVEEIAVAPETLDQLTATLRAALADRLGEPVTTAEIGNYRGLPLMPDATIRPGVVHLRPKESTRG
ncbi:hypothetical protein OG393_30895 [Streptomyces sp. NBC_01216]|uniref:hypothetical protein n=1 Tax=Streptomyces sp. NBC_01216 TaxID=2903778 RepID=UPI002E119250|nr:hypothetical protein OG393_30895 [Streptomyces sp. NBC_01216]